MQIRKTFIVLFVVLIFSFSFLISGCFGKKEINQAADIKLRVYAFGSRSEELYLENVLKNFSEKYKELQAELRVAPLPPPEQQTGDFVSGYEYLLLADFAASDPPDVFFLNKGRIPAYIENKALLDLSPYLTSSDKKLFQLSNNKPIYALPYFQEIQVVAAFSTKNPEKSSELLLYLAKSRLQKEAEEAEEALKRLQKATEEGAGILDRPEMLYDIWNNLAFSYQNKEILLDEDSKHGDEYLICHEQAYRYPYMMLQFSTTKDNKKPQVTLVINQQYIENPTLRRNISHALKVLIRSIHKDIDEEKAQAILTQIGLAKDASDLSQLKAGKSTQYGNYEFQALGDYVSLGLKVTRL